MRLNFFTYIIVFMFFFINSVSATQNKIKVGSVNTIIDHLIHLIDPDHKVDTFIVFDDIHEGDINLSKVNKLREAQLVFVVNNTVYHNLQKYVKTIDHIIDLDDVIERDNIYNDKLFNPHVWFSIKNNIQIISTITKNLMRIDPENDLYYFKNYEKAKNKFIDIFSETYDSFFSNDEDQKIIFLEPTYDYYLKEFDLASSVYNMFNEDVLHSHGGLDFNLSTLNDVLDEIKEEKDHVKCLIVESKKQKTVIEKLIKQSKQSLEVIFLDSLEHKKSKDIDLFDQLEEMAEKIEYCLK